MKPQLILLLLYFTIWQPLQAQDTAAPLPVWGVHLTPSAAINFYPRLRLGGQVITERYSYLLDVSYANFPSFWNSSSSWRKGYSYFALRPEIRQFITTRPRVGSGLYTTDYWGLELALSQLSLDVEGDAYEATDGEQYSFDQATRLKRQLAVHLKYGSQRTQDEKMYIDLFIGVGLRLQYLQYQDISNRILRFDNPTEEWLFNLERKKEGWSVRPSVTMGLRLGLAL